MFADQTSLVPSAFICDLANFGRDAGYRPPARWWQDHRIDSCGPWGIWLKRFLSLVLTGLLIAGVAVAVIAGHVGKAKAPGRLTTVRGIIGSEKQPFFADPRVRRIFANHGLDVEVDTAGSRQIATTIDLARYDFAFPSSSPAALKIQLERKISTEYAPFYSPMAIATFTPIAQLLRRIGVARPNPGGSWTFDVGRYLDLARKKMRWNQIAGNTAYPVRKDILITTTDPRDSNSAAMYLSYASYVANGDNIVHGTAAEKRVLPLMSSLFLDQGYTQNSSQGPFDDYLALGMGNTPMVNIYEAQFVAQVVKGDGSIKPDMVLMYPSPTVLSKHTLVPLDHKGDQVGRLLTTDPGLQRLAADYGFRTQNPSLFDHIVAQHKAPVLTNLVDVVDPPSYDTLENLLDAVGRQYQTPALQGPGD